MVVLRRSKKKKVRKVLQENQMVVKLICWGRMVDSVVFWLRSILLFVEYTVCLRRELIIVADSMIRWEEAESHSSASSSFLANALWKKDMWPRTFQPQEATELTKIRGMGQNCKGEKTSKSVLAFVGNLIVKFTTRFELTEYHTNFIVCKCRHLSC